MDVLSGRINHALAQQKEHEFSWATNNFRSVENIFNRVDSEFGAAQTDYLVSQFQENLAEQVYERLQEGLSHLRKKEQTIDNASLTATSNIVKHEAVIKNDPVIAEIEGKITENQSQIMDCQNKLSTVQASPAIMRYVALSREVNFLKKDEMGLLDLIAKKAEKGEDTSILETKLEKIRKKIEEKEQELNGLKPEFDKMQELQQNFEELLSENSSLVNERFALDKEFVRYSKVYTLLDRIIKGNGTGSGILAEIKRNKSDLTDAQDTYLERSEKTSFLRDIFNKKISARRNIKSDLNLSKFLKQEKESHILQIKG